MRHSAISYMAKRGILASIIITTFILLLSTVLGAGTFWQVVLESAGNSVPMMLFTYLMVALFVSIIIASIPGALIGGIVGTYIERYIQKNHSQITDQQHYARELMLHSGGFCAVLMLALMAISRINSLIIVPIFFVLLAGIAGALIGRGYAYYDMAQRREKKNPMKTAHNE